MKIGLLFLLLAALAKPAEVRVLAVAPRGETIRWRGTDYISMAEWTRRQGLKWRWLKRDESFQLTNRAVRFQFLVDSREAHFNGLQLWLLFPVVSRNGDVYLAQLDADATLRPVLSPARNSAGGQIKIICLDPGHGGKEAGYHVGSNLEKDYTLRLAFELREQLRKVGFKVVMTRSTDKTMELPDRPALAQANKADLFVSLHFNATDGNRGDAKGAEVYALTPAGAPSTNVRGGDSGGWCAGNKFNPKNLLLACEIQRSLVRELRVEDRGVRRARFAVLRDAAMPAVLIEAGFMSHPMEGRRIFDATYRREMARAILHGINSYQRIVER